MVNIGVVVGRFQPPHLGHKKLFERALRENKYGAYVVLVKGIESGADLAKNPLDTETQEQLINYLVPDINVMESSAGSLPEIIYEILEPANVLYPGEDSFQFTFYCGTDRYEGYKKQAETAEYMRDVIDELEEDHDYDIQEITAQVFLVEREQQKPFDETKINYGEPPTQEEIAMYSASLVRQAIVSGKDNLAKRMMGNPTEKVYQKATQKIKKGMINEAISTRITQILGGI